MLNVAAGLFADHANNVVHLSGLLAGYLLSVVLEPRRQGERRPVLALVTATTLAATFAVLLERSRTAAVGTLPWAIVASEMDELAGRLDPAIARLEDAFGRGEEGSANQLLLPFAQNQLAWYYVEAGRNLERALVLSEESNRLRPSLPMFLDTLGYVYAMLGRCPEAADRMGQAADLDPGYGRRRDEVNGACAAGRRPDPDLPVDPPPAETPPPGQRMRV
jgi:tetratricopeptide (TPR) repeat protein